GFAAVGFDLDAAKVAALQSEGAGKDVLGVSTLRELADALKSPRAIMLLVPAGKPVDAVISDLTSILSPGDVIIDGGNSHFVDTDRRAKDLATKGLAFVGMGVSGGESGARHGPSLMPGGDRNGYESVRTIFEAVAAQANGEACVEFLGPRSAGHYVK